MERENIGKSGVGSGDFFAKRLAEDRQTASAKTKKAVLPFPYGKPTSQLFAMS
jgi:hypothetical protein